MKKNKIFTSIMIILVILVNLCLAEIIIRIYNFTSHKERWIWTPDPFIGFIHSSNNRFIWEDKFRGEFYVKHETNQFGLMGEPISEQKPAHTFRILILGDSFTEAIQVKKPHSYSEVLEFKLNEYFKDQGLHVEVLNGGVSGYSPIMSYLLLKEI